MKQPNVSITIAGVPNTGKTAIGVLIKDLLSQHGIACEVNDPDLEPEFTIRRAKGIMHALGDRGTNVNLNVVNVKRPLNEPSSMTNSVMGDAGLAGLGKSLGDDRQVFVLDTEFPLDDLKGFLSGVREVMLKQNSQ